MNFNSNKEAMDIKAVQKTIESTTLARMRRQVAAAEDAVRRMDPGEPGYAARVALQAVQASQERARLDGYEAALADVFAALGSEK